MGKILTRIPGKGNSEFPVCFKYNSGIPAAREFQEFPVSLLNSQQSETPAFIKEMQKHQAFINPSPLTWDFRFLAWLEFQRPKIVSNLDFQATAAKEKVVWFSLYTPFSFFCVLLCLSSFSYEGLDDMGEERKDGCFLVPASLTPFLFTMGRTMEVGISTIL